VVHACVSGERGGYTTWHRDGVNSKGHVAVHPEHALTIKAFTFPFDIAPDQGPAAGAIDRSTVHRMHGLCSGCLCMPLAVGAIVLTVMRFVLLISRLCGSVVPGSHRLQFSAQEWARRSGHGAALGMRPPRNCYLGPKKYSAYESASESIRIR
jgi:hypothetical protein